MANSKEDPCFGEAIQVLESKIREIRQENTSIKQDNAIMNSKLDSVLNLLMAQQSKKDDSPIIISLPHLPVAPVDNSIATPASVSMTNLPGSSVPPALSVKRKEADSNSDSEADDLAKLNKEDSPIRKKLPVKKASIDSSAISVASDDGDLDETSALAQVRDGQKLSSQAQDLLQMEQPYNELDVLVLQDEDDDLEALNAEEVEESVKVSDSMAELINNSFRNVLDDEKINKLKEEFVLPGNCQNLVPPMVNTPIWKQMSKFSKSCDISVRETQLRLGVAGAAVASSLSVLQKMKKEADPGEPKEELGKVVRNLGKALKLMGSASHSMSLKRRKGIRPCINANLSPLCAEDQPVTDLLYGNHLFNSIRDVQEERRLESSVAKKVFSFQGGKRYFFRGRGVQRGNQQRFQQRRGAWKGSFQRGGAPRGRGQFPPSRKPQARGRGRGLY